MADEGINMHKRLAMGAGESTAKAKGKSVIQKYKSGGSVMSESRVANLPAKGSAPPPLARPAPGAAGKIATMKKGGAAKKMSGFAVTIAIPVKKSAGRGR
jgi:hypothetical protein